MVRLSSFKTMPSRRYLAAKQVIRTKLVFERLLLEAPKKLGFFFLIVLSREDKRQEGRKQK